MWCSDRCSFQMLQVNFWAIGKPNPTASLTGHSSGLDSVSFDSSEVFVAAGAARCTIKLCNLEESKIVRTIPGHRPNCISLDFHPFGEIFASGSSDTNLKIWDIRLKGGCIRTYKGHTRGVNAIRFTLDGRWVVSGGEDNTDFFLLEVPLSMNARPSLFQDPEQLEADALQNSFDRNSSLISHKVDQVFFHLSIDQSHARFFRVEDEKLSKIQEHPSFVSVVLY
ncbi:katanin p80 WD40 repeat-containing subunit B1 homolog KTN80.4 isoform X2 [Daucus carota subsp. sativus]|uniref:katanin p80 WD40 repeat-containing subunit B1 homolog KTN80.4 isoform X2 n=1 Tax=Daucus carota subsp. sativus TaxID=79200 RepID=UPI0007EFA02C|nr:PREDICTED: katanin p80 WD40 repeat-containing subunit B1 homolog isoform X2 [Daucus carota subsp. sativus]